MRLQRIKAYSKDDRDQYKYQITLPIETIESLGWEAGSELQDSIKGKSLVIDRVSGPQPRTKKPLEIKMTYEEFRDKIKSVLQYSDGMAWTEIREKLKLPQVVPNNKWVHDLEKDVGLLRIKGAEGLIWRIKHV